MSDARVIPGRLYPGVVILLLFIIPLSGCAFIPTPVRLVNKPHSVDKQPPNGTKICIIVKDERPEAMQKVNMCGLMRNGYMIPTSIAFLAHPEQLDVIMAYHLSDNLQHLGYEVVAVYPAPPSELREDKREAARRGDILAAMKLRDSQKDSEAKEKGKEGTIEPLEHDQLSPWGSDVDVSHADLVIEVKIRKFFSDCNWLGVFGWASVNMAVCRADSPTRDVLFGKKLKGFGYGTGLTPLEAYGIPVNASYWFVMHGMEKAIASPEFQGAVSEVRASDART